MVLIPLEHQKDAGDDKGKDFGGGDGPPDTVHAQKYGQDDDGAGLEHKRPQEGDGSGDGTVVQGGEEAGGKDVEACQ